MQDPNPLWGGIVTDLSVDLTVRSVVAAIRVTESDASRVYRLRLHDVGAVLSTAQSWAGITPRWTEVHVCEVFHQPGLVTMRVGDDGTGGAHLEPGGGLVGLAERVKTV